VGAQFNKDMTLSLSAEERVPPVAFVGRRPSVVSIVSELWHARDLLAQFVQRDLTVRYAQAIMGFGWALLMPILIVGAGMVFRVVLAALANVPIDGAGIASLGAKALPWAFFSGALSTATQSLLSHLNLIGKIYFPREALPIGSVIAQCTDLVIGLIVLLIAFAALGIGLHWSALWTIVVLVLLIMFTTGWALLLSCANLFFRDVKYILQVALSFGVFATPVFFEPQMLGKKGAALMLALPLSPFIQAMDLTLVQGHGLLHQLSVTTPKGAIVVWSPWMLGYAATLSVALLWAGLIVFRSVSSQFAEMA
jgi:lipopolysaccharide transport system permease protein